MFKYEPGYKKRTTKGGERWIGKRNSFHLVSFSFNRSILHQGYYQ